MFFRGIELRIHAEGQVIITSYSLAETIIVLMAIYFGCNFAYVKVRKGLNAYCYCSSSGWFPAKIKSIFRIRSKTGFTRNTAQECCWRFFYFLHSCIAVFRIRIRKNNEEKILDDDIAVKKKN